MKSYFASKLTEHDVNRFGYPIGSPDGQQIWEALAILVAVDIWHGEWTQQRIQLKIKGDNVTALTLMIKMRPKGPIMAIVARELALRLARLSFPPDAIHTPGLAHIAADRLSRVFSPEGTGRASADLHHSLQNVVEVKAPVRDDSYYVAEIHGAADKSATAEDEWVPWSGIDY